MLNFQLILIEYCIYFLKDLLNQRQYNTEYNGNDEHHSFNDEHYNDNNNDNRNYNNRPMTENNNNGNRISIEREYQENPINICMRPEN